jgi:hypothetical protein
MPDAPNPFDPARVTVGPLAPDAVDGGGATRPAAAEAPPAPVTLAPYLAELDTERTREQAGAVPLPAAWRCVRAVIGGASRRDLEDAHAPRSDWQGREIELKRAEARVVVAADEGATLPAGLHVVTGQTGGGKTALAVNMVRGALEGGHPAVYVSLELDGGELAARLLALDTGLTWWKLAQRRTLPPDDATARRAGIAALTPGAARVTVLTPESADNLDAEVQRAAHDAWRTHGRVPLVVFDYLQAAADLPASDRRAQLREYVGELSRDLRTLSREMRDATGPDGAHWPGCPVVVLSITARGNVRGEGAVSGLDGVQPDKLRLAPLEVLKALPKEAGAVEAYAVTSWVLAGGEEDEHTKRRPVAFRVAKYRGGPPGGWVPFSFDGRTGTLDEAPERYATAPITEALEDAAAAERAAALKAGKAGGKGKNGNGAPAPEVI